MKIFYVVPLLLFNLLFYILFQQFDNSVTSSWLDGSLFNFTLSSGDVLVLNKGHVFMIFSLLTLNIELVKATQTGQSSLFNHILSVFVFLACMFLFLLVNGYGNAVFLMLTIMTFTDFLVGFIISVVSARRDIGFSSVSGRN